jgi:nucleoside-diphosphate-sugar epimerase
MRAKIKVAVTGAVGHLGSRCVSLLASEGYDVVATDVLEANPPEAKYIKADLTDSSSIRDAIRGAQIVVHCASIHPWREYTDSQYIDTNIKGTWNLYREAAELGIKRVVLTSSISAIGYPEHPADLCPITEERLFPLNDLYSLTKNVQETIAKTYAATGDITTIALRPPPFMPKPWLDTGFLLTGVFAIVDDIASAHVAAANWMVDREERPNFEAFFVVNELPYTRDDVVSLGQDANVEPLVKKHWPSQYEGLIGNGYRGTRLVGLYDISKARERFGWSPKFNFLEWFEENSSKLRC